MAQLKRTPFIAGNWKMNLDHLQAIALVQKLDWNLNDAGHSFDDVEVAVFPPFTDLRSVQTLVAADNLSVRYGAQDVSQHESGAYTGDISAAFLAKLECDYVIVGHSERRGGHGESDEVVAAKAAAAVSRGITPVVCVGETAEDLAEHGASAVPVGQLKVVLDSLKAEDDFVVAYEPVWAIGSGKPATPHDANEVAVALRATIRESLGDDAAERTRILYGGSVKAENIASYMTNSDVDGALVGGASLDADAFSAIARYQQHVS